MTNFRDSSIAISSRSRWCLARIAKALKAKKEASDPLAIASVDALAEDIIESHLAEHYPGVLSVWEQREALSKAAEDAAMKVAPENPPEI